MSSWPAISALASPLSQVDDLARIARQAVGAEEGALPLRDACDAAKVSVEVRPLTLGQKRHRAMLVPTDKGFRATVDRVLWEQAKQADWGRHRLRFVLAHELGHTFFYRTGNPPKRERPADREEEQFCHHFANSLLVPPAAARRAPLEPEGLFALAGRFDVSLQVAAWAITRARPSVTLLWLRRAPHPTNGGQETMRVEWGASLERFIAVGESLKSPLAQLSPGEHDESTELLHLAGRRETTRIRAWRLSSAMLAIVTPEESESTPPTLRSQQAAFF